MTRTNCAICLRLTDNELCSYHNAIYMFDKKINGYKLKKKNKKQVIKYKHQLKLTKVLESFYGSREVVIGYHPLWAKSAKGALLEFDIFIPKLNLLIEYNGIQHYSHTRFFHTKRSEFLKQKRRDKRKQRLAITRQFKLLVFKYDEPLFEDYVINKIETHVKRAID